MASGRASRWQSRAGVRPAAAWLENRRSPLACGVGLAAASAWSDFPADVSSLPLVREGRTRCQAVPWLLRKRLVVLKGAR